MMTLLHCPAQNLHINFYNTERNKVLTDDMALIGFIVNTYPIAFINILGVCRIIELYMLLRSLLFVRAISEYLCFVKCIKDDFGVQHE